MQIQTVWTSPELIRSAFQVCYVSIMVFSRLFEISNVVVAHHKNAHAYFYCMRPATWIFWSFHISQSPWMQGKTNGALKPLNDKSSYVTNSSVAFILSENVQQIYTRVNIYWFPELIMLYIVIFCKLVFVR